MITIGTVESLWRYPVKSMRGERLAQAPVDVRGILGDRLYAVRDEDGRIASGKNTRRFRYLPGLLEFQANYLPDLTPVITLPDGQSVRGDDEHVHWALATTLGRPGLTLVKEGVLSHFDEEPLHIVTTATLRWLADLVPESEVDERRLRPNLVIRVAETAALPEDDWVGRALHIGGRLVVDIVARAERCAMLGVAQDDLDHSPDILRAVAEANDLTLGVHARVRDPGRIKAGDPVLLA